MKKYIIGIFLIACGFANIKAQTGYWNRKHIMVKPNNQFIMKFIVIFSFTLCIIVLFYGCKDEELLIKKTPYNGNELRIDGYYYRQLPPDKYKVFFFYRNGVMIYHIYILTDLQQVEDKIPSIYEEIKDDKLSWGVFEISGNKIQYSSWSTSVGGGLPAFKSIGMIENDSSFRISNSGIDRDGNNFEANDLYHFRKFSPKPDSTNRFIP